jgi:probable HAF family extracellular repeat protein
LLRAIEALEPRFMLSNYTIEDLGTLGGNSSQANAINAKGEVVGAAQLGNGSTHATLWDPAKAAKDLGTLGGTNSAALAINVLGEVVGSADSGSAANQPFDFLPGGSMTDLTNAPPSGDLATLLTAKGVNDTGIIVGQALFNVIDFFATGAYSFDPASTTLNELDFELGVSEAVAVGGTRAVVNNVSSNVSKALVADVNTPNSAVALPAIANQAQNVAIGISLPDGSGTQFATGFAIDTSGNVHAVVWTIPLNIAAATVTDLGHVSGAPASGPAGREARGANSLGDIVGDDVVNGSPVAFVKDHAGAITLLSSLLPAGSGITLEHATGINDSGQISATGLIGGKEHAFRLTPALAPPPQASLTSAPDETTFGAATYQFDVTYKDSQGINSGTVASAIQVTGPGNFSQTATVSATSGTTKNLVVTYSITAPGGTWDFSDDGTYTVTLKNNVVKSTSGQSVAGGTLGHFIVAVAPVRGSISGTVFNDANANGHRDAGEAGVPLMDVFLDLNSNGRFDSGDRLAETDANGAYTFGGLLPGVYFVKENVFQPHAVTSPANDLQTVNLAAGQTTTGIDFGDVADPQIITIIGQSLALAHGSTPQFDQQGTLIHIIGNNFQPGDVFFFGNDQSATQPINLAGGSNPQSFGIRVSKYATTGPLVVLSPNGRKTVLLPNFIVDNYRNTKGYSFVNDLSNLPDFSFDEMSKVYGDDQTHITVDPAGDLTFGLVSEPVDTGIPNPLVYAELAIINEFMNPNSGLCLGFSLSSARLSLGVGPLQIGDFATQSNTDGSTVWDLAGPNGPSPDLLETIRLAHLEQTSAETLGQFLHQITANEISGVGHLVGVVKGELAAGRPAIISLEEGGGSGHAVLCYNVEDLPGGSEQLDIYDPNNPYEISEEKLNPGQVLENGSQHKANVDASTITFDSNGNWKYNASGGGASGGLGSIAALPLSTFDDHTILASISGLAQLVETFAFGSAKETQVTDSSGHHLLNADGSLNTNASTRIPNAARYVVDPNSPPIDLFQGSGNFMQTIVGSGNGTYGAASMSNDAIALINGVPTANGQTDKFGLNPANDMLMFTPATTKPMTADLVINAPQGVQREAQLTTTASGGALQTMQFMGSLRDHVVLHNNGAAGKFTLNLTSNADGLVQTFTTGRMALASGDTVDLLPTDWADVQTAKANVLIKHQNGTTTTMLIANGGKGEVLNVSEAVSFTHSVARFTNLKPAGLSAIIDWGDGTTSHGTLSASGNDLLVSGSHKYAKQGYFPTRISLSDASGPLGQATGEAVVADTKFTLAPVAISAFSGVPFSGKIATLTDVPSGDVAADFNVSINWGDGTTSAGTLQTTAAGKYDVHGSHTWATPGTKSVVITVTERGSASGQGHTIKITSNKSFSGTVAQMQLPLPGSLPGDYVATIDWGDGKKSTGTLTLAADGTAILKGSHTYAATGNFVTHFSLVGGPSAKTTSTATVRLPLGTVTGTAFFDVDGNGKKDAGEAVIAGRTVFIDKNQNGILDAGELSAVTNSSGVYTIANVPAGTVRVMQVVPSGFRVDSPTSGFFDLTLKAGQTISKLDFANTQLALVTGTVFLDSNGNKTQDAGEGGRANRNVFLDMNGDGVRESNEPLALTDANGVFAFTTVTPGLYTVRLQPIAGFKLTTPAGGGFDIAVGHGSVRKGELFGEKPVTPKFAGPANLTTLGAKPVALVVADFNNDKHPDIATADSGGNDVTIFMNNGNGTYAAGKKIAVGHNPVGIVAGDFNGDGKVDLAVADQGDNAVHFLIGAGNGTFKFAASGLAAAAPNGIAAFNFNGDNTTDLVVSDRNTKQITLFLSKKGGGFAPGVTMNVQTLPNAITIADVNGDGFADILVSNSGGNGSTTHGSVSILLGNGKGGFGAASSFPDLTGPASLTTADFDGDGSVDIITANPGNTSAAILFGDGKGHFSPGAKLNPGTTPQAVVAGDFNGDGIVDLAAADAGTGASANKIAVSTGKGDGTFAAPLNLTAGTTPQAVAAADVNGDGKLDLIAVARDSNRVVVLLNTTT